MNNKIIFGIVIPVIIIVILAIIASLDIGFSVEEKFVKKLSLKDVFQKDYVKNSIKVGDITLSNEYFLPKRYTLEYFGACLIDKDGEKQEVYIGNIQYSEGDSIPYDRYNYENSKEKSVEVRPNSKKTISLYMYPSYNFQGRNYTELISSYGDYDEIIVYKDDNSNSGRNIYSSCGLSQEDLDKSIHIPISV